MDNIYQYKYLKYKKKYLELKNTNQIGGYQASLCSKNCGRISNYFQIDKNTGQPFTTCCGKCNGNSNNVNHTPICNADQVLSQRRVVQIIVKGSAGPSSKIDYHITVAVLDPGIPVRLVKILSAKIQEQHYPSPLTLNLESTLWGKNSVKVQSGSDFYNLQQNIANIVTTTVKTCGYGHLINTQRAITGIPPPHIDVKGNTNEIGRLSGNKFSYVINI